MTDAQIRRRSEVRALARLALEEIGGAATGIGSIHRAISDRVFAGVRLGVGSHALPAKLLHDEISGAVYALVADTARIGGSLAGRFFDLPSSENLAPSQTRRGAQAIAAIQGLIGDVLEAEGSPLAEPLAIRVNGVALAPDRSALADAFPHAGGRIVVFLHGLVETEDAWALGRRPTYGERLGTDLGYTALQIRYNSGRHISDERQEPVRTSDAVTENWPVEVESIALVGHSMGGLVARSACRIAFLDDRPWVTGFGTS